MSKTLPGYETILLMPAIEVGGVPWIVTPDGLVDYEQPTADALNVWQAITSPADENAAHGGNISCAIQDDLTLGLTDSDSDDSKTVCSKGNTADLTFYNFSAELNAKRDEDVEAEGLLNLWHQLTRAPDVPYFIAHRVRGQKDSTEPFGVGDEVDLYYVHTDNQVVGYGDNEALQAQAAFIPKNVVNVKYTIAA